jgi:hypothetical protein
MPDLDLHVRYSAHNSPLCKQKPFHCRHNSHIHEDTNVAYYQTWQSVTLYSEWACKLLMTDWMKYLTNVKTRCVNRDSAWLYDRELELRVSLLTGYMSEDQKYVSYALQRLKISTDNCVYAPLRKIMF